MVAASARLATHQPFQLATRESHCVDVYWIQFTGKTSGDVFSLQNHTSDPLARSTGESPALADIC